MSEFRPAIVDNPLVRLGVAGLAATGFAFGAAGCDFGGSSPETGQPSASTTHQANLNPNNVALNYDAANDYLTSLYETTVDGPASIPKYITNSAVRRLALRAANLRVADDVLTNYSAGADEAAALKEVNDIGDPTVKTQTEIGLVLEAYSNIVDDLNTGNPEAITGEQKNLEAVLKGSPAGLAKYQKLIASETKLADTANANLPESSAATDKLLSDSEDADTAATDYATNITYDFNTTENLITARSPKAQAQSKQSANDYQVYLHKCDNPDKAKVSKCAADEAVSDADNGYNGLFAIWVPKITDPTQKARIEDAAANQAISDIEQSYTDLATTWQAFVRPGTTASDKIDKAFLKEANSDKSDYPSLADAIASDIRSAAIKAQYKNS